MATSLAMLAGVDGCRGGWCVATPGDRPVVQFIRHLAELASLVDAGGVVAIDMPVVLASQGDRLCDRLARQRLGWPRSSSVFSAPVAGVLQVADYDSARTVQLSATGKSLSKQSWYLVPKIREVVEILTSSVWQIYEVHPELSFAALGGDRTVADSKHTACGLEQRAAELSRQFDWPVETIPIPAGMARDDVFDALALLWSAERIAAGHSTILGDPPMAIHF